MLQLATVGITNVYYVPSLNINIMSCGRFDNQEVKASFKNKKCCFIRRQNDEKVLGNNEQE